MRRIAALLLVFVLLLAPQAIAADDNGAAEKELLSDKDVVNILLIGTDARAVDESARSDVMMLVSMNRESKKLVMTSLMRDIYTDIPGYGSNRLNAAYAFGGAELLIETLEADFGIRIDNYAAVDFFDFAGVIDVMGGVDLELTTAEVDFINEQTYSGEQAQLGVGTGSVYLNYSSDGWYHLNGSQTLAHCRNRSSAGSDFDRTGRQRAVLYAAIGQVENLSMLQMVSLGRKVLSIVRTDITLRQGVSLLLNYGRFAGYTVETLRVPGDSEYTSAMINGMAVLQVDFAAAAERIQEAVYG